MVIRMKLPNTEIKVWYFAVGCNMSHSGPYPGGAAEILGIHPSTLRSRMRKLGVPYGRRYISAVEK